MKRYLIFYGDHYYPYGGMDDFYTDCESLDKAVKIAENKNKKDNYGNIDWSYTWSHVYDTHERKEVWNNSEKYL